ncbi:MAG: hypothetical protein IJT77_10675 [Clostridia bacterium]|nr:hypothetical protein [Clostridia bacterium]
MKTIQLIDRTLRDAVESRETVLSFKEKLEMARSLDRLKVDRIELPPVGDSKADQLFNKSVAAALTTPLCAVVPINDTRIEMIWDSIHTSRHPSLNVEVPCSPVQMEYAAHKKAPALLEAISAQVRACRNYCEDVGFTATDATRAERGFLADAIRSAVEAGAGRVILCDTAGVMLPDEFAAFAASVMKDAAVSESVHWAVQINNAMHMTCASAVAAIAKGIDGLICSAFPGNAVSLDQIADFVRLRGEDLNIAIGLRVTELRRTLGQLQWLMSSHSTESSTLPRSMGQEDNSGISLTASDDAAAVAKVVSQLGYDLSDEDNARVYEAFRRVAVKKGFVTSLELDAIVASTAMQVPSTYRIESYVINSGNVITATANITLDRNGQQLRGVSVGDGPIDAAFLAIEQIIGHHYELDDFQIQAVTEGREAMGSALVKLRADGRVYAGNGISTDIIGAAIRAYISALNKIIYEEV